MFLAGLVGGVMFVVACADPGFELGLDAGSSVKADELGDAGPSGSAGSCTRWKVKQVLAFNSQDDTGSHEVTLDDGWEPFAAKPAPHDTGFVVILRRCVAR